MAVGFWPSSTGEKNWSLPTPSSHPGDKTAGLFPNLLFLPWLFSLHCLGLLFSLFQDQSLESHILLSLSICPAFSEASPHLLNFCCLSQHLKLYLFYYFVDVSSVFLSELQIFWGKDILNLHFYLFPWPSIQNVRNKELPQKNGSSATEGHVYVKQTASEAIFPGWCASSLRFNFTSCSLLSKEEMQAMAR